MTSVLFCALTMPVQDVPLAAASETLPNGDCFAPWIWVLSREILKARLSGKLP